MPGRRRGRGREGLIEMLNKEIKSLLRLGVRPKGRFQRQDLDEGYQRQDLKGFQRLREMLSYT